MLLHVIAVSIGVVAQSLKPVRLLSRFARTVAEQCLIRLHSSSNVFGATHVYHSNLKWTRHVDYIIKKANKGLYSLRVLKQCEAPPVSLAKVFVAIVRPILEYALSVWKNIPEFHYFHYFHYFQVLVVVVVFKLLSSFAIYYLYLYILLYDCK